MTEVPHDTTAESLADFTSAVAQHDGQVDSPLWIGAEPTFTLRESQEPCWLWSALGPGKEERAWRLLVALAEHLPRPVLLRAIGRQYPGEPLPRFSFGAWWQRSGAPAWSGPPDPWLAPMAPRGEPLALREALAAELRAAGGHVRAYEGPGGTPRVAWLVSEDSNELPEDSPLLHRPSIHSGPLPESGLVDEAAAAGVRLFEVARLEDGSLALELPSLPSAADFLQVLGAVERACARAGVGALVLRGFAPPVEESVAWLTVTPDPGVVEVNMAPAADLASFHADMRAVYAAAAAAGLSPVRYRFNGQATDSGGGGQLTFGGPSPRSSPFFLHRQVLPGLLRYLNRHPSLSYWFAMECLGSASQGPRTDEGVRERFEELAVALDRLVGTGPEQEPAALWSALAPLLVDGSGNAHRAEVNIEKLYNPYLPGRGQLGLVELRALRMAPTPERLVAVAGLFRALLVRLRTPYREPLVDWGAALHDRFALPCLLEADLREVLADLEAHGLGLAPVLTSLLLEPPEPVARLELGGASLSVRPALEFWPLVGDVASQENRTARLVDSSTARLELLLTCPAGTGPGRLVALGWELPLVPLEPTRGVPTGVERYVVGVRYRHFLPSPGLHPGLQPLEPLRLGWERGGECLELALHDWRPGGGAYEGLPESRAEAARRRAERAVVSLPSAPLKPAPLPLGLHGRYTVDLRRLGPVA